MIWSVTGGQGRTERDVGLDLRGVDATALRGRMALIVDEADLARLLRSGGGGNSIGGLLVVEKRRGHDLVSHGAGFEERWLKRSVVEVGLHRCRDGARRGRDFAGSSA